MLKYCHTLLLLGIFSFSIPFSSTFDINVNRPFYQSTYLHNYIIEILEECQLGIKNIIIYDCRGSLSTYEEFSILQPELGMTILSELGEDQHNKRLEYTETEGIVIVGVNIYVLLDLVQNIKNIWRCTKNCTIILIPRSYDACYDGIQVLKEFSLTYAPYIYYVCLEKHTWPTVYTYDPYNDTRPPFWQAFKRESFNGNELTFYRRRLQNDAECRGFTFNRTKISSHNYITFRLKREVLAGLAMHSTREGFYDSEIIKRKMQPNYRNNIDAFRKLLKCRILFSLTKNYQFVTDMHFVENPIKDITFGDPSFPSYYIFYVIASHNQGFLTPLERIGKYYGPWTLISLVIILIISFIVIWIRTDKNISFAAFDIIRFLINSGIAVPINTLPLRIFFSVIFIYFLVIHATLSGHLAEFLTLPALRKNIDSVSDLSDSHIETIRKLAYDYENDEINELLKAKSIQPKSDIDCMKDTIKDPKSVCLVFQDSAIYFATHPMFKWPNWYFSKEFSETSSAYTYQRRFPLREKFDWALMTMTETQTFNRLKVVQRKKRILTLLKKKIQSEIEFRVISLKDVTFAFILLSVGLCLAFVCFLFENLLGRKWNLGIIKTKKTAIRVFHEEEKKSNILSVKKICCSKLSKKRKNIKIIVKSK